MSVNYCNENLAFRMGLPAASGFPTRIQEQSKNPYRFDSFSPKNHFYQTPISRPRDAQYRLVLPESCRPISQKIISISSNDEQISAVKKPYFGSVALNGVAVLADLNSHLNGGVNLAHTLYGTGKPFASTPFGFVTCFLLITSPLKVKDAIESFKKAMRTSDVASQFFAGVNIVNNSLSTLIGAIYIPIRALAVKAAMTASKAAVTASKAASSAAAVLGKVGSGLFSLVSLISAINFCVKINEQRRFNSDFFAILSDPALSQEAKEQKALEYLKSLLAMTPEDAEKIRIAVEKEAQTPEQRIALAKEKETALLAQKEALMERLLSSENIKLIKEKTPAEAKEVIDGVKSKTIEKTVLNSVMLGLLIIGLSATLAAMFFTGPVALILLAATGVATSFGWLLVDGYDLIKSFKESDRGRFDKMLIFLSSVVCIAAISTAFFLTGGIVPLIVAGVIGTVWMGINIYSYIHLQQLPQKSESQSAL